MQTETQQQKGKTAVLAALKRMARRPTVEMRDRVVAEGGSLPEEWGDHDNYQDYENTVVFYDV